MTEPVYDLVIVGAGPIGLSLALHARRRGLRALVLERGAVAQHLLGFPTGMAFFTPRESLELVGIPLDTAHRHATREELLSYYGRLARLAELELHGDRCVERVTGGDGDFAVVTRASDERELVYRGRRVVIATGVFGTPRRLAEIPGGALPKVHYLYREPFTFAGRDVVIVGVGNSAAGAALALYHAGARVTVLDRNASIPALRWRWQLEDVQRLIRCDAIRVLHQATLVRVEPDAVWVAVAGGERRLANDAVIVLIGYQPDRALLARCGVAVDPGSGMPAVDNRTLETATPGLYVAGIMCAGTASDLIFVWGARHHAKAILHHIAEREPLPGLADLGSATVEHWAQFERVPEVLDEELALRLVPYVAGELRDDLFDVYAHATNTANLYAETPARSFQRSIGPIADALEGWMVRRAEDGAVVFKGQRLTADAFAIVRLCDGSRRLSQIVAAVAAEYDHPEAEVRAMVTKLVFSLLRSGRLLWRVEPAP